MMIDDLGVNIETVQTLAGITMTVMDESISKRSTEAAQFWLVPSGSPISGSDPGGKSSISLVPRHMMLTTV